MRTKNAKPISQRESDHIARVKLLPCGVCDGGGGHGAPSEAHHIEQGSHFTVIPLCEDCHRGQFNGLHGQQRMWKVVKATEMSVLNETIRALYGR